MINKEQASTQNPLNRETIQNLAIPNLIQRVTDLKHLAQREAGKADSLSELEYLLGKNPEVARILALLELLDL